MFMAYCLFLHQILYIHQLMFQGMKVDLWQLMSQKVVFVVVFLITVCSGFFLPKLKSPLTFFTFILQIYIRISWKSHGLFCLGWKNQEDAVLYNAYKKINLLTQFLNMLSLGFYKLLNSFNPPRNKVVNKIKIQLARPINWIINWIYISKN